MPLNPLSALSLAASIIQFVDFTSQIVSKGKQICRSYDGTSDENTQYETVANRLRTLTQSMQDSLRANLSLGHNMELQQQSLALQEICVQCTDVAGELLTHLRELKLPAGFKHRKWKAFVRR